LFFGSFLLFALQRYTSNNTPHLKKIKERFIRNIEIYFKTQLGVDTCNAGKQQSRSTYCGGSIMKRMLQWTAAGFYPGYFSFIMATGIVSIAAFQQRRETVSYVLLGINALAYSALAMLMLMRTLLFPKELLADATLPNRAPALFTITAGTCLLGSQFLVLSGSFHAGISFWVAGLFFWMVLSYTFFTAVIVRKDKTTNEGELNGSWLIYVVGTQAAAVITILLTPYLVRGQDVMLLVALSMHGTGIALYVLLIVLINHRMMFLSLPAEKLTPPYWINMGAAAISTLAGAELILHAHSWGFLQEILPALKWTTLVLWAVTTWWIPLMVVLNVWRYGYKRFPIAYDVEHWSMVFPLGMYAACTFQLGKAAGLAPLLFISSYFFYLALAAWILVFIGMFVRFIRRL
jgi:tellurite resistance protein TehA-like permease